MGSQNQESRPAWTGISHSPAVQDDAAPTGGPLQTSRLLSVPPEIRNKTYEEALLNCAEWGLVSMTSLAPPALLQVSGQIRKEAAPIFYGQNVFDLSTIQMFGEHDWAEWERLCDVLGHHFKHINFVRFQCECFPWTIGFYFPGVDTAQYYQRKKSPDKRIGDDELDWNYRDDVRCAFLEAGDAAYGRPFCEMSCNAPVEEVCESMLCFVKHCNTDLKRWGEIIFRLDD
ncbi:putative F-box domain-containing protein [Seiridium cardinale]|uniref:F-box domain-containing protein n=1 Tax=Seiridium cardinale TaxID=138064 RepID=A0ABR2XV54_9PEZI